MKYKNFGMVLFFMALPSLLLSFVICNEAGEQHCPSVASDGTNFLVIWQDKSKIWGQLVDNNGDLINTNFCISTEMENFHQCDPSVAFNGSNYLVVWHGYIDYDRNYNIYGRFIAPDGTLDQIKENFLIFEGAGSQYSPVVASDGTNFLVVWEDWTNGTLQSDIYGQIVDPTGNFIESRFAISDKDNGQHGASITFGGSNYLVVWHDYRNEYPSHIYGQKIDGVGNLVGNEIPIATAPSSNYHEKLYPDVAFDGTNFLVVWGDENATKIYGKRVTISGTVIDANNIEISDPSARYRCAPKVAFDGTNYLTVWQDSRDWKPLWNIYGKKINYSNPLDPSKKNFLIYSKYSYHLRSPTIAFGNGKYLVVWEDNSGGNNTSWDIYGKIEQKNE